MTIASAISSLGLVYNVVAGGNRSPVASSSSRSVASSDSGSQEQYSPQSWTKEDNVIESPTYQVQWF